MSQANNLKVLKFIESKGEQGCTNKDFNEFDRAQPIPFHPILNELITTGKIKPDEANQKYYLTAHGREYKMQIEEIESQDT